MRHLRRVANFRQEVCGLQGPDNFRVADHPGVIVWRLKSKYEIKCFYGLRVNPISGNKSMHPSALVDATD